ncbi:peroxide stress protein YaaA [Brackiella oedipodis]|uniref:peroxide stress protein YaaA n=1 Tax=Brackiella oedipodis TaxID=124225 RepID=UPI00048D44A9|nr:peroxide stress protein YaaA [Brackiella oedipodis]
MLFVLSPAKKLDYDSALSQDYDATQPLMVEPATELIAVLKQKSPQEIADLMKLSDNLAQLNYERYQDWQPEFNQSNARQAILAFNGDVYEGLQANTLNQQQMQWAQEHVLTLSGLYGVLRPLDLMRPYRLEMGTRLATDKGKNLYEFWGSHIADYINQRLAHHKSQFLINLASEEYFKSVDRKTLKYPVITVVFQEKRDGKYKVISFNAKKARGYMTRFAIEQEAQRPEDLKAFNTEGYAFDASASDEETFVFRREQP